MNEMSYEVGFAGTVDEAVPMLEKELRARGFGVLANLRVHDILREKIGSTIEPVVLLDVCSPRHAERALAASRDSALLLPCKVVVSREQGRTRIALLRPTKAIATMLPEPSLVPLAEEVESLIGQAIDAVGRAPQGGP